MSDVLEMAAAVIGFVGLWLALIGGFGVLMGLLGLAYCRLFRVAVHGPRPDWRTPAGQLLAWRWMARRLPLMVTLLVVGLPLVAAFHLGPWGLPLQVAGIGIASAAHLHWHRAIVRRHQPTAAAGDGPETP